MGWRHQCLSAGSPFRTRSGCDEKKTVSGFVTNAFRRGVLSGHKVLDAVLREEMSPMPFGGESFPDEIEIEAIYSSGCDVTNAFRRGVLSGR